MSKKNVFYSARVFKINERSEYFYIGLGDFMCFLFSGETLEVCSRFFIFRGSSSEF